MKTFLIYFSLLLLLTSCGEPTARRPVSVTGSTFFKESVERNQKLLADEETIFKKIFERDSIVDQKRSESGFWYRYAIKDTVSNVAPISGDLVSLRYEIKDINNRIIYSEEENGDVTYLVDKQNNLMPGLRSGIKLMKIGEKVTFFFPSSVGYGYHGDNKRIGVNVPLIATVTLFDIKKEENKEDNTNSN